MEAGLDLLREPLERSRFVDVLKGFYGFHAVWEPGFSVLMPEVMAGRRRLNLLGDDLRALGLNRDRIAAIPRCVEAAALVQDQPRALGSLYVIEGSTLGGAVIGKALEQAPWAPGGGIRYFSPYGRMTAARWRQTLGVLEASHPGEDDVVVEAALRTFELLGRWLVGERTQAA
jgi:heme oxygenase